MGVQWSPFEYWSGATYPTTEVGQEVRATEHGLRLTPDVIFVEGDANSMATDAELQAEWYQPTQSELYTEIGRINANEKVRTWGVHPTLGWMAEC